MACEKAMIGTSVGGIVDAVTETKDGESNRAVRHVKQS
jgi:hypothetical protein